MSFTEFFVRGGILMYPIAVCFLVAVALTVERALYFFGVVVSAKYLESVRENLARADYPAALAAAGARKGPISNILRRGIGHMSAGKFQAGRRIADFERQMREGIITEMKFIFRSIDWIGVIAQISPLLGLLGTVQGLLDAFLKLSSSGPDMKQLSGGIGVALITTVAGLVVGIPAMLSYEHFMMRAKSVVMEMERIGVEMANAIAETRDGQADREIGLE